VEYVLLLIGAFLAAAVSGSAGFGGALLLLPFLTIVVGAKEAVPLLTVAQLIGNLSRAGFGFRQIRWRPVALFVVGALPASILGALSFIRLDRAMVTRGIGAVILVTVLLRLSGRLDFKPSDRLLVIGGAMTGFLSGVAGSAGPLGAAVFLSLGLPPVSYVASEASTALVIHAAKIGVYGWSMELARGFWLLGAALGGAMILGTWTAKRLIEHVPSKAFERYVSVLLIVISIYMVLHG
jgi:uncharacterized membrane protein YfcA